MGHGSDKLYITHSEWSGGLGEHSLSRGARTAKREAFQRLPFDCCALSLQPFENPVAVKGSGTVFDLVNIIPYIRKYGTNPTTGAPLSTSDLIKLNFHKNANGEYFDPVTFKVFNEHTHIVALTTSGNVFSWETIEKLNIKAKHWKDLISDQPFKRSDILVIQDPQNLSNRDMTQFDYVKSDKNVTVEEARKARADPLSSINLSATGGASAVLQQLAASKTAEEQSKEIGTAAAAEEDESAKPEPVDPSTVFSGGSNKPYNAANYSTGRAAASLTSTALDPSWKNESALIDEDEYMFDEIAKLASGKGKEKARGKAYVRIVTNLGALNVELHCERAPKTCYNWLMLARGGKYNDVVFHRNIPGFMIQGGDPTGTGRGGESFWGTPFRDEYDRKGAYKHDERGVLSMANSGASTNGSQFFFTYRATPHLDGKHTVFGRLVGGQDILTAMEHVPVDKATDRPRRTIKIESVHIFADPFEDYKDKLAKRLKRERGEWTEDEAKARKKAEREKDRTTWFGTQLGEKTGRIAIKPPAAAPKPKPSLAAADDPLAALLGGSGAGVGVGKYLGQKRSAEEVEREERGKEKEVGSAYVKKKARGGFGDFQGW